MGHKVWLKETAEDKSIKNSFDMDRIGMVSHFWANTVKKTHKSHQEHMYHHIYLFPSVAIC